MLPVRFLNRMSGFSKFLWRKVDEFRFAHKDEWDGRVFMPLDAWRTLLANEFPEIKPENRNEAMRLFSCAGAWRPGQDIVKFDPDFQKMLCGTRLTGKLPSDCLVRLPAWCVYFDTGAINFNNSIMDGFFAFLEENECRDFLYLRLVFLGGKICKPILLPLGDWTLERSLKLSHDLVNRNRVAKGLPPEIEGSYVDDGLHSALNMVLYVCSQAMDRKEGMNGFGKPSAKKVKKSGWRIFPPSKPNLHIMGNAQGEQFRHYMAAEKEKRRVAPHMRRPHWHGFWHGPLKGERDFRLRWLSPIPVNMREELEEERRAVG